MIFFATSRRPCPDKNVPLPRGNEAAGRNRGGSGAVRGGDPSVPDLPSGRGRRRMHPPVLHVRIGVGREDWVGMGGRPVTHMSCWHLGAPLGVVQVARIPAPPFDERRADLADLADLARHRASPHGTALLSPLGSPRRPLAGHQSARALPDIFSPVSRKSFCLPFPLPEPHLSPPVPPHSRLLPSLPWIQHSQNLSSVPPHPPHRKETPCEHTPP